MPVVRGTPRRLLSLLQYLIRVELLFVAIVSLMGCHQVRQESPAAPVALLDAEVFPVVAAWADSQYAPGPVIFDPRPSERWRAPYSLLAPLSRAAVATMESTRKAALTRLGLTGRVEKDLDRNCVSARYIGMPGSNAAADRRGCPSTKFTYVVVMIPYHGAGRPQAGGLHQPSHADSAYVLVVGRPIGPGGWSMYSNDLVLARSGAGWKVVQVRVTSYIE